jgi:hypothetical protein
MKSKNFDEKEFYKEFRDLLNKYNIQNAAFGAEMNNNTFFGSFSCEKEKATFRDLLNSFANTARIYQSAREKTLILYEEMATRRRNN